MNDNYKIVVMNATLLFVEVSGVENNALQNVYWVLMEVKLRAMYGGVMSNYPEFPECSGVQG